MSSGARGRDGDGRRVITDARTMRAVAHPVRLALLEALTVQGPLTATKAAELLDDSPGNMSWHLQTLAKYGFVEEAGGGKGRSRPWQVVQRINSFETAGDDSDAELAAAGEALEHTFLQRTVRRFRDWNSVSRTYPGRWRKAAFTFDTYTFLTPAEMEKAAEEIGAVIDRYRRRSADPGERPKGALPIHFVAIGHPVPPPSGRDHRSDEE